MIFKCKIELVKGQKWIQHPQIMLKARESTIYLQKIPIWKNCIFHMAAILKISNCELQEQNWACLGQKWIQHPKIRLKRPHDNFYSKMLLEVWISDSMTWLFVTFYGFKKGPSILFMRDNLCAETLPLSKLWLIIKFKCNNFLDINTILQSEW